MRLNIKVLDVVSGEVIQNILLDKREKRYSTDIKYAPCVVVISGEGVLSKNVDETARRITTNPDIVWQQRGDIITFARKSDVDRVMIQYPEALFFTLSPAVNEAVISCSVKKFYSSYYTIGGLIKSSHLQISIFNQLKMPILLIVFVIVAVNYVINSRLAAQNSNLTIEVSQLSRVISRELKSGDEQKQLLTMLDNRREVYNCQITDMIASVVPMTIALTRLSIDPITERLRKGKDVKRERNSVFIKGITKSGGDVAKFAQRIGDFEFVREAKISKIEADKRSEETIFEILVILNDK